MGNMAASDSLPMPVRTPSTAVLRVQIEDLAAHLKAMEAELERGHRVELVRGDKVIAEMRAPELAAVLQEERPEMPDFMARMRKIFGDKPLNVDTTAWVREDRDGDEYVP